MEITKDMEITVWPVALIALLVVISVAVFIGIVLWKSPAARSAFAALSGVVVAVALILGIFASYSYRSERESRDREPATRSLRVVSRRAPKEPRVSSVSFDGRSLRAEAEKSGEAESRIATDLPGKVRPLRPRVRAAVALGLPDDLAGWRTDSVKEFVSEEETPDWLADAAGSERATEAIGDTDFVYWRPGASGYLVGYSEQEATRRDALAAARTSVRDKLSVLALMDLKKRDPALRVGEVQPLARRHAGNDRYVGVHDGHVEWRWLEGRAGTVWRAAVRVHADPSRVRELASEVERELERGWLAEQETNRRILGIAVAGVLITFVVFLLYSIVNAGTKGHFAWPLRGAAVLIIALLCLATYWASTRLGMIF